MYSNINFSIILPTYNRAHILSKSIDSVVEQDFYDWELIIIDDASTDNTIEVVSKYNDDRIIYHKLIVNSGVNIARNTAIDLVKNNYILLLDSDNLLTKNILSKYYQLLLDNKYDYIKFPCMNQDGIYTVKDYNFNGSISYKDFLRNSKEGEYATLVKSSLLKNIKFSPDINGGESITWKLIAKETKIIYYIPIIAIIYNDSGEDRLSVKNKNYHRLAQVFYKDITTLFLEYIKYAQLLLIKNTIKFSIYKLLSLMVR
jgi:glycosyltransferase involved in cell wall biosynthesis